MDTNNPINHQTTNEQVQEPQLPSSPPEVKRSYWKLGFFVALLLWLLSVIVLVAYFNKKGSKLGEEAIQPTGPSPISTIAPTDTIQTTPTPTPSISTQINESGVSVRINVYRSEIENDQLVATFRIENLNKRVELSKVTYWTDNNGPCEAKTEPFSNFIKIPVDESRFSFFQFTDENGNKSQIYASSHIPIFQCGKLAE